MMKAKRSYKENLQKVQEKKAAAPKLTKEEKKIADNFARDMERAKEEKQYEEQCAEFETFLRNAAAKNKPFQFLVDMHDKLVVHGSLLSENMVAALRKCKEREEQWAKERETKKDAPARSITLKVKPFIMKKLNIDSRIITGLVKAESKNAWLIEGHADMLENMCFCARCGRELTEPASQVTGFGAVCADKLGIPYDAAGVLQASKKERAKIRKEYQKKLHNQKFECWIPKSQAEEFNA
jgi:hypothetical protein